MSSFSLYRLFGLTIASELPLPEAQRAEASDIPDVVVRLGSPEAPDSGERLVFEFDDAGRYVIDGSSRIAVEPRPGVSAAQLRLYLLGSVMAAVLHRRGMLPLHANAIAFGQSAVAFMGPSGAGKSSLAAWFHDHGHRVISDDVSVIGERDGRPFIWPGPSRIRLWDDAMVRSGRDPVEHERSFPADPDYRKRDLVIGPDRIEDSALPLGRIYLLDRGEEFAVEPLEGAQAAEALFANTYRGHMVMDQGDPVAHWRTCMGLIEKTRIFRARRRWSDDCFDEDAGALAEHAAQQ